VIEWLDLLPYAEAEDVREWLGERGAWELHQRDVRDVTDRECGPAVAAVLADLLGEPSEVIEGSGSPRARRRHRPTRPRSFAWPNAGWGTRARRLA